MLTIGAIVMSLAGLSAAQVSDANKLGADVAMLNIESELPQGEKIITNRLLDDFNVTTDTINSLIVRNMKYGDIAAIFAFAETLPGGLSNDSINEVTILRERGVQWDQAAAILVNRYNINVSDVAVTVSRIEDDSHNSIELAIAESLGAAGSAAGGAGQPAVERRAGRALREQHREDRATDPGKGHFLLNVITSTSL